MSESWKVRSGSDTVIEVRLKDGWLEFLDHRNGSPRWMAWSAVRSMEAAERLLDELGYIPV